MSGIIFAKKITQSMGLNSNMIITGIAMFSQRIQMENISLEVYTNLMHKTPPLKSAFTRGLQRLLTCPSGIKVKLFEEPEEKQTFDRLLDVAEKFAAKHE